ncbi:hypothetical protein HXX02_00145 [Microbulbifer elongatus]|uniref:Uncharacterized protein n=1 Tax=Microbulbifer elongatus TaxID=86173 RepID=A0ABT1NVB8_9GAMM|nr:hypothetical protein [Microbulbifer elongatus]MCQ3827845.1 hypothetical protein [Microbulbifer elongatus]
MNIALIIICIAASHFVALFAAKRTKDETRASVLSAAIGVLFFAIVTVTAVAFGYIEKSQILGDDLWRTLGTLTLVAVAFGMRGWQVSLNSSTRS